MVRSINVMIIIESKFVHDDSLYWNFGPDTEIKEFKSEIPLLRKKKISMLIKHPINTMVKNP